MSDTAKLSMGIGVDRREKDGTVSVVVYFDDAPDCEYTLPLNWRDATKMLVTLHHSIHVAAHHAGVDCEGVNDYVDEMFNEFETLTRETDD